MFDIVVIGGNIAGATAAINAASKGTSVALVERNKEPFNPAHCGELIPFYTAQNLNLDKIGCYKNEINNLMVTIPPKEYVFALKKNKMVIFDRNYLEKELLKQAEKKGVDLKLGISMKDYDPPYKIILDNDKKIEGKIIIDASGIACQVGRRIGLDTKIKPEDIGVCIQSRVEADFKKDTMKMWYHEPFAPFAYAWVFPLNDKIANIGIGVPGGQKLDLVKNLKKYIEHITNNKYEIRSTFRSCVPLAPPISKLTKDNVMIVGDAARLVYSESGGGIDNALFSGRLAGIIAAKYINGEISSLNAYQNAMRIKLLRIKNGYKRRKRASKTNEKYIKKYQSIYSLLSFISKLSPNISYYNLLESLDKISTGE